jgi:hypothetical protein
VLYLETQTAWHQETPTMRFLTLRSRQQDILERRREYPCKPRLERLEDRAAPGSLLGLDWAATGSLLAGSMSLGAWNSGESPGSVLARPAHLGAQPALHSSAASDSLTAGATTHSGQGSTDMAHGSAPGGLTSTILAAPTVGGIGASLQGLAAGQHAHGNAAPSGLLNFDDVNAPPDFNETIALRVYHGVFFDGKGTHNGGAILNQSGNFGVTGYSPPNFLAFNSGAVLRNGGIPQLPELIKFPSEVNNLSLKIGSGLSAGRTVEVVSFDPSGNQMMSVVLHPAMTTVQFTGPTQSVSVFGKAQVVVIDDVAWS